MGCMYFLTSDVTGTWKHCSFIFRNLCHRCNFLPKNNLSACIKPGDEYFLFTWKSVLKRQFPGGVALFKVLYSAGWCFFLAAHFKVLNRAYPPPIFSPTSKWSDGEHLVEVTVWMQWCRGNVSHIFTLTVFLGWSYFHLFSREYLDMVALSGTQADLTWRKREKDWVITIGYATLCHFNGVISSCIVSALLITCRTFL